MNLVARAPGKLVLSGAYAVLEGAPAIVTAVDRYASADASRCAEWVTPEVEEALRARGVGKAPSFDASALREKGRKLGLGSSAAILVASLAAIELRDAPLLKDGELAERVLRPALLAHRRAQGGGSGIDVVASALGGTQRCELVSGEPVARPFELPKDLHIEVWSSPDSASTASMLRKVEALRDSRPAEYRTLVSTLKEAAEAAVHALSGEAFLEALGTQADTLARLGKAAGAPIVTEAMAKLDALARENEAVMLPSGAGGGDVVLWVGFEPTGSTVATLAKQEGFGRLSLSLGARGVHSEARAGRSI